MARNTTVDIAASTWTQLTSADVTELTFQNTSPYFVLVKGTTDATAPADKTGAFRYNPGQGEMKVALADMFPGIAAVRVWAWSEEPSQVVVSHA